MSKESVISIENSTAVNFGDEWAENYSMLIARARHLTAYSNQEPEDLLSQATVKVLNYLSMKREIENFAGLMLLSLLQVHLDSKRRISERIFAEALELFEETFCDDYLNNGPGIEQAIIDRETLTYVFDRVATLPESYQQVFQLRFLDDLSFAEISELLGVSEVSARQKIRQLRLRLKSLPAG